MQPKTKAVVKSLRPSTDLSQTNFTVKSLPHRALEHDGNRANPVTLRPCGMGLLLKSCGAISNNLQTLSWANRNQWLTNVLITQLTIPAALTIKDLADGRTKNGQLHEPGSPAGRCRNHHRSCWVRATQSVAKILQKNVGAQLSGAIMIVDHHTYGGRWPHDGMHLPPVIGGMASWAVNDQITYDFIDGLVYSILTHVGHTALRYRRS